MQNVEDPIGAEELDQAAEEAELARVQQLQRLDQELGTVTGGLSEAEIDRRIDKFLDLGRKAYASNTMKAWGADWTVWCAYCDALGKRRLPAEVDLIEGFLKARIVGDFRKADAPVVGKTIEPKGTKPVDAYCKRATLERYLSTIRKAHQLVGMSFPGDTIEGELAIRGQLRRLPRRQGQKAGLTHEHILAIDARLTGTSLKVRRDRALVWMAYSALTRRSEVVALRIEHLREGEGGAASVLLEHSKSDQEGEGALLYLRPEAVHAIDAWLDASGLTAGPILRALAMPGKRAAAGAEDKILPKEEHGPLEHGPGINYAMNDHHVARTLKRLLKAAGYDPNLFSGHSARIGAAQDMSAAGLSKVEIGQAGRWRSEKQIARYTENVDAGRSGMSKLAELQKRQSGVDPD